MSTTLANRMVGREVILDVSDAAALRAVQGDEVLSEMHGL